MEAIMMLACGPARTLTETQGHRSRRPLAASLWGFRFKFTWCRREQNQSCKWNKDETPALEVVWNAAVTHSCLWPMDACAALFKSISHLSLSPPAPPTSLEIYLCGERALRGSWIHPRLKFIIIQLISEMFARALLSLISLITQFVEA